jgi:hypothetical protein
LGLFIVYLRGLVTPISRLARSRRLVAPIADSVNLRFMVFGGKEKAIKRRVSP